MSPQRSSAPVALAVLVVALFAEVLLGPDVVRGRDLVPWTYPRCEAIGTALASLEVPRWNPWSFHGQSWFGPRAGGVLYPGYVLFGVLAPGRAMALFIALHTLLAAEGARRLAPRGPASVAAGVAYGLGGFVTAQHWSLPYLVTASLLPWAALGARALAAGAVARGAALVAATTALALLVSEPQGALTLAAVVLVTVGGFRLRAPRPAASTRALGVAALAVALGVLAAAPQVVSLLTELPTVDRAQAGWASSRFEVAPLALALDLVAPGALGERDADARGYWGFALWSGDLPWCGLTVGALGLAACVTALAQRPRDACARATRRLAVGLVLAGLALAVGGLDSSLGLRFPAKWLVLVALGLALLVGLGVERLAAGRGLAVARSTLSATLAAPLCAAALLLTLGAEARPFFAARTAGFPMDPTLAREATTLAVCRASGAALLALALLEALARTRLPARQASAVLVGLLALDLLTAARSGIERGPADLLDPPPLAAALQDAAGGPPGAPVRYDPTLAVEAWLRDHPAPTLLDFDRLYRAAVRPNVGYTHDVRAVHSFEAVRPGGQALLLADARLERLPGPQRAALFDAQLLLVGPDVVSSDGATERVAAVELLATGRPALLLRNLACPPWAYLVPAARAAPDLDLAIGAVTDPTRRPLELVVLGPEGGGLAEAWPGGGSSDALGEVILRRRTAEAIDLEVRASRPSWLVVREAWSTDWVAAIDGAPAQQGRADVLYRALRVPAGAHEVALRYAPAWWTPSITCMASAWVALGALALRGRRAARALRKRAVRKRCDPCSSP